LRGRAQKGVLQLSIRGALKCQPMRECDLGHAEFVWGESGFGAQAFEVGGNQLAEAAAVGLIECSELVRLASPSHRVELKFRGQQAPAAVLAEHTVATLDRRGEGFWQ
jgi:hypothetical protein